MSVFLVSQSPSIYLWDRTLQFSLLLGYKPQPSTFKPLTSMEREKTLMDTKEAFYQIGEL